MEKEIEEKREKAYWTLQTWIIILVITMYCIMWNPIILIGGWIIFVYNAIKFDKFRKNYQKQNYDHDLEHKKE